MTSPPAFGILHPGAMGASLGGALVANGYDTRWVMAGRSPATRDRAEADGLTGVDSLTELAETCDVIVSVCPPAAAADVSGGILF